MKNLWWAACDKDDLIISEMHAYVHAKMKKWRWCWCCCKREQDTCEISINKRSKKGNSGGGGMVVVSVVSHTEIKEWLHYYALCGIATHHGAQLLLSL
jgi:hypothetical protein